MQQCCIKRQTTTYTLTDEDWQSATAHCDINWFRIEMKPRPATQTGDRSNKQLLHMTVINLRLTLLKGSACQRVRHIGNKSPIQSECEGNTGASAFSSMLTTCWLSVFQACQTQWVADSSIYKPGSLFLQPNWFSLYRWWWIMSGLLWKWQECPLRDHQENTFQEDICRLKAIGCYIS